LWRVWYSAYIQSGTTGSKVALQTTLSTANNSESDSSFTCATIQITDNDGVNQNLGPHLSKHGILSLTAKDTYYLNERTDQTGCFSMLLRGDKVPAIIRATSTLL